MDGSTRWSTAVEAIAEICSPPRTTLEQNPEALAGDLSRRNRDQRGALVNLASLPPFKDAQSTDALPPLRRAVG